MLLAVVFNALAPSVANAQYGPTQRVTPYYLNMDQQPITLPTRTLSVEQVVDGRAGRPPIGLIYKGLEVRAPAFFQKGLEDELTSWLASQLPKQAKQHAVVLCIRQLQIDEIVQGYNIVGGFKGAQSTANVAADVYEHQADGYHFVRSVAAYTSSRGIDANSRHAARIATVLQDALTQLNDVEWNQMARRPARTLAQLVTDKPSTTTRPAILRAAMPRKGAYLTLEQFLTNRPDTTVVVSIDTVGAYATDFFNTPAGNTVTEWKGTVQLKARMRTAAGEKLSPKEVWGFSDGRQSYMRQLSTYRPLIRQGDFFTFVGAAPVDLVANRRAQYTGPNGPTGMYGPDGFTGQPIVYSLDLRSGQTAPYPAPGLPQRADTAFVYVYRPLGGFAGPERVYLNDREAGQLKPGQYLELAWSHLDRPMRLAIDTPGGPAILMAPNTSMANYVKLLPNLAASSPWQIMPVRQGEAEVDALEKRRKP
jgi:hypothetical protein